MDRNQFYTESTKALEYIEENLADLELDSLDVDLAGDVLTISFDDGNQFIINAHSAAEQIWMAAGRSAWHFDFEPDTGKWIAHKTGDELMRTVSANVGEKIGQSIRL